MIYHQPPDTGGRNAISSPSETGCDMRENVAFTAHESARSNGFRAGTTTVAARQTIATVAGSETSTVIVSAPASSFRRAKFARIFWRARSFLSAGLTNFNLGAEKLAKTAVFMWV